jgi:hypothetical protein
MERKWIIYTASHGKYFVGDVHNPPADYANDVIRRRLAQPCGPDGKPMKSLTESLDDAYENAEEGNADEVPFRKRGKSKKV